MIEIRTYQHVTETGEQQLKDEQCPGICVRGTDTPEECPHYLIKMRGTSMIELCSRDEEE